MAHVVADTYAKALFELCLERRVVDDVYEEFKYICKLMYDEPDFYEIFQTPKISIAEKKKVIKAVFAGRFSATMVNFLNVLADKRRTDCIVEIFQSFEKKYNRHHNRAKAIVRSVVPLSDEQKQKLTKQLTETSGYKIELENIIDPSLIGGLRIRIGDHMIDHSVKTGIHNMKDLLIERFA